MAKTNEMDTNSEDRLELALKASNEGIWDWIIGDEQIYYSRRILEFLGCSEKQAPNIFLAPHTAIHESEKAAFTNSVSAALEDNGRETLAEDVRVQTGDGNWLWLRIRGTIVRDRKGVAQRIAGSMIDISRRKAAEAQIEEERHILRTLIDHVPLQIYYKDLGSHIIMANQGMAEYHGLKSSDDLIGKHDRDLFSNTHWEKAAADEKRIIETGTPMEDQVERETWVQDKETFVLTSKFPWRDKAGTIKGTFGVSSNVTSLVLAQRQATELANTLKQKNIAYEEEVNLAREIQQALIQTEPITFNAESGRKLYFESRYMPISGLAGDFFEVFELGEDSYGVFICDVMGHGVRAALIVQMLRGLLNSAGANRKDASGFLGQVNEQLSGILANSGITMFATACYTVIDLSTKQLNIACAGHPGPLVVSNGQINQLCKERKSRGPALGLVASASYTEVNQSTENIQNLLFFTDGLLEAENEDGERFMEKRLSQAVLGALTNSKKAWLDQIIDSVLDYAVEHHFDDDVCLLGLTVSQ